MLLVLDEVQMGRQVAERRLGCPSCPTGRLRPWGYARRRVVELLAGQRVLVTPRRARCGGCGRTQVLLPAWCVPRRAHAVEVIGTALGARLHGGSYRAIAAELALAADTVRGWVRRLTTHAEALRVYATRQVVTLDPDPPRLDPQGSPLADALHALAAAVHAAQRRLDAPDSARWPLAGIFGLARHLAPARGG